MIKSLNSFKMRICFYKYTLCIYIIVIVCSVNGYSQNEPILTISYVYSDKSCLKKNSSGIAINLMQDSTCLICSWTHDLHSKFWASYRISGNYLILYSNEEHKILDKLLFQGGGLIGTDKDGRLIPEMKYKRKKRFVCPGH